MIATAQPTNASNQDNTMQASIKHDFNRCPARHGDGVVQGNAIRDVIDIRPTTCITMSRCTFANILATEHRPSHETASPSQRYNPGVALANVQYQVLMLPTVDTNFRTTEPTATTQGDYGKTTVPPLAPFTGNNTARCTAALLNTVASDTDDIGTTQRSCCNKEDDAGICFMLPSARDERIPKQTQVSLPDLQTRSETTVFITQTQGFRWCLVSTCVAE